MTRFARAKGSKSCNVKQPEEPTSWAEMKKGMQMQLAKQEDYSSARSALDSVKKEKKVDDKPAVWGTLGGASDADASDALCFLKAQLQKRKEKNNDDSVNGLSNKKNEGKDGGKKKKKKKMELEEKVNTEEEVEKTPVKNDVGKKLKKRKNDEEVDKKLENENEEVAKKKSKKSKKVEVEEIKMESENKEVANKKPKKSKKVEKNEVVEEIENEGADVGEKRKLNETQGNEEAVSAAKRKKKTPMGRPENSDTKPKNNKLKRLDRKKKFEELKQKRQVKREKLKDLLPQERRRKPLPETQEAHINGQTVQLEMFDGFWVTKEDAERLKKLKHDMFQKNIPFKDINGALKLERRRAEKALARLKKKVCFQCRKSGHALSECPEITESHNKATNVCYKCGSTEHTAYVCKVSQGNQFRFAECFICKEQGHIAKQCPDNPRGLYPKGGSCNVCGDVTHLKKDCPQLMTQKEEAAISVGVRDDRMIEDLDEQLFENKNNTVKPNAKRNKHVKF